MKESFLKRSVFVLIIIPVIILYFFYLFIFQISGYEGESLALLFLLRIFALFYCQSKARNKGKSQVLWSLFGFFSPIIAIFWIGSWHNFFTKKLAIFSFIIIVLHIYLIFSIFFQQNYLSKSEINIESDYTIVQVIEELNASGNLKNEWAFKLLSKIKKYENNIKSGSFYLEGEYRFNDLINIIRIGNRKVIDLQIPENVRLIEDMIVLLEDSVGYERGELKDYLDTSNFLQKNNLTMETLPAFFIPNTYQIYEGVSVESFLYKMKKEYQIFWNTNRLSLCDSLGITQTEVSILASIVEEEQDKRLDERSKIAGLYLNRLRNSSNFPYLQADPTVKFANKNFGIKQVLNKHLKIDNLYNTYKYKGLPPGPICIPSIQAIDAVLNYEKHDYYFMCAGSNGDGYHKFTSTNKEHNKNKQKFKNFEGFN